MPLSLSSDYNFLFLEQYYLLHRSFDLNTTQRIVNFRINQGKSIYLYDLDGKTLYYTSKSLNQIKDDFKSSSFYKRSGLSTYENPPCFVLLIIGKLFRNSAQILYFLLIIWI